jgi:hypothetical protein
MVRLDEDIRRGGTVIPDKYFEYVRFEPLANQLLYRPPPAPAAAAAVSSKKTTTTTTTPAKKSKKRKKKKTKKLNSPFSRRIREQKTVMNETILTQSTLNFNESMMVAISLRNNTKTTSGVNFAKLAVQQRTLHTDKDSLGV